MESDRAGFIEEVVDTYFAQRDRYAKMALKVETISRELLRQHAIRGNVQSRAKDPDRLRNKLSDDKYKGFNSVPRLLARISDLSAARITTYVETDREKVVARLKDRFELVGDPDIKDGKSKSKFYRATHVQVTLPAHECTGDDANLSGVSCEIQVCSMLAHVYNEVEHDLGYKTFSGELSSAEVEALDAIGNIVKAGDTLIVHAIERVQERNRNEHGPFKDEHDFITRLRPEFPQASHFADNAGQLYDMLSSLGISSPNEVRERFLKTGGYPARAEDLLSRLNTYLEAKYQDTDMSIRHLPEPESSDLLMALAVESKDKALMSWLATPRQGRPTRLVYLAGALRDLLNAGG